MSSDVPRAGLINEARLPMWHWCGNQISHQACSFPLWVFLCVHKSKPAWLLFYDKDITFSRTLHVCASEMERERVITQQLLVPPKSLQWDLLHTYWECGPLCVSRFNYITWSPAYMLSRESTGHCGVLQGSPLNKVAPCSSAYIGVKGYRVHNTNCSLKYKPQILNNLWLTSKLLLENSSVIFSQHWSLNWFSLLSSSY